MLVVSILVLIGTVVLRHWHGRSSDRHGRPLPGPKTIPVIGNLFSLDVNKLHKSLTELAKTYGGIFRVELLGKTVVVLNDAQLVRKALASDIYGDTFNDRPETFTGKYIAFNCSDIAFGKTNKTTMTLRKMLHRGLKFYGEGVVHFEQIMEDEMKNFLTELSATKRKDFDISVPLRKSFANATSSLMTGTPPDKNDAKIIWKCVDAVNIILENATSFIYEMAPFIRLMPGKFGNLYREAIEARDSIIQRFYYPVKESELQNRNEEQKGGLIQMLIRLQDEKNNRNNVDYIHDNHLKGMVFDIVFAATDSTAAALVNCFSLLVEYQSVAMNIQDEIDMIIGRGRTPKLSDRSDMPLTMATVLESLRYSCVNPIPIPHQTLRDCNFEGYHVPKHATILINLWHIHHDSEIWDDPWSFCPERFLDDKGDLLPPEHPVRQNLLTFTAGHRSCPGETLAKSRMFLYLSSVLQSFDLLPASTGVLPDNDPIHFTRGLQITPQPFQCRAVPRQTTPNQDRPAK